MRPIPMTRENPTTRPQEPEAVVDVSFGSSHSPPPLAGAGGGRRRQSERRIPRQFDAFENSLDILRSLRALLNILRSRDRDLEGHINRAAKSIALNVAEGNRRVGKDQFQLFRVAAGGTDEVRTGLRVGQALGYFTTGQIEQAMDFLDRQAAMLKRLTARTGA